MFQFPIDVAVDEYFYVPTLSQSDLRNVPVILPKHSDASEDGFAITEPHYHLDNRFLAVPDSVQGLKNGQFSWARLKCHRHENLPQNINPFIVEKLHRRLANARMKNRKCPHQGVVITNRCGTCPAHGLVWDLKSGLLRYQLPFYLCMPDDGGKAEIVNGRAVIWLKKSFPPGVKLYMEDANGEVYPNASLTTNIACIANDSLTAYQKGYWRK